MVRKEVELCDICEKIVAEGKCELCGRSICKRCSIGGKLILEESIEAFKISFFPLSSLLNEEIIICKDCYKKIMKGLEKTNRSNLTKFLLKNLFDFLVAEEI